MDMREDGIYKVRIRYSETDKMGFVYYGNYARFYEIGRTEMMRAIGPHRKLKVKSETYRPDKIQ